jgi:hypothetical protein
MGYAYEAKRVFEEVTLKVTPPPFLCPHDCHVAYQDRARRSDVKAVLNQVWRWQRDPLHRLDGTETLDARRLKPGPSQPDPGFAWLFA